MDSRFRKLDILSLSEVEREVDTLIEIIGDRIPDDEEYKQVSDLMSLAKSLGTKRVWQHDTPEWGGPQVTGSINLRQFKTFPQNV